MSQGILYVIRPVAGGMREHLSLLVKHLDRKRFEPRAIVARDDLLAERLRSMDVETLIDENIGKMGPTALFKAATLVRRAVIDGKPALVHSHGYRAAVGGGIGARLAGVPHVVTVHTELGGRARPSLFSRLVQKSVGLLSRRVIVVSDALAGFFDPAKTRVVDNGVEVDVEAAGWRWGGPRIGFIGRLSPEKGVDIFVEAAAIVHERVPTASFVAVGEGLMQSELERRVAVLGIGDRFEFAGFVDEAKGMLGSLDALILPSRTEGQPMVLLEALAAGCPVVATDVGGVRNLLDGCGEIVPPENPEAIAKAIERLLTDPEAVGRAVDRGKEMVAERYPIEKMVAKTMEVYEEALA